jgi:hypothetical protein
MPYKSKAERERERWMTLPEAVTHIRSADNCDVTDARQRLLKLLADGLRATGPLKWEKEKDDKPPPFGSTSMIGPSDTPPLGQDWLKAKIRWRNGKVRNDWTEHKYGKWRTPLLLRAKVEQHWPVSSPAAPTNAPLGTMRDQSKRPHASPEVDRATLALKVLYPDGNVPDQTSVPNKVLLRMVNGCLVKMTPPLLSVKIDSCNRAAGRRKDAGKHERTAK